MNLVDSCGWLEFFADGPGSKHFAPVLQKTSKLIVPSMCIYEVFKSILRQAGETSALKAVAAMHQGKIIDLDSEIAILAGQISLQHQLPMADSIVLATARKHKATIWTQDADFKGLDRVRYFPKR